MIYESRSERYVSYLFPWKQQSQIKQFNRRTVFGTSRDAPPRHFRTRTRLFFFSFFFTETIKPLLSRKCPPSLSFIGPIRVNVLIKTLVTLWVERNFSFSSSASLFKGISTIVVYLNELTMTPRVLPSFSSLSLQLICIICT